MKVDVDNRNRVTRADRGEEASGSITGTARMDQIWSLDQVGNWDNVKTDLNGDNDGADAGELNDTRTYNTANELLTRSAPSSTQAHDAAGQMTYDGQDHNFKYDAFGRLVKVTRSAVPIGTSGIRAEYKYDGLGQRIGWHCDLNADDDVTTADPWMWFVFDDRWRIVSTYRVVWSSPNWVPDGDTRAKERFVHHAAGFDSQGGSSYIDALILSDRDNSSGWTSQGDQTLEERYYYLQNWRNDLCALTNDGGVIVRRFRYSAYGARTEIAAADYDADGGVDAADSTTWNTDYSAPNNRADVNHDGAVDYFDYLDFVAITATDGDDLAGGKTRNLYAGYENDPALEVATSAGGGLTLVAYESIYHVRHRVYATELGRWTRRDPLGYVDGMGLEEYCRCQSLKWLDPTGLEPVDKRLPAQRQKDICAAIQDAVDKKMTLEEFLRKYSPTGGSHDDVFYQVHLPVYGEDMDIDWLLTLLFVQHIGIPAGEGAIPGVFPDATSAYVCGKSYWIIKDSLQDKDRNIRDFFIRFGQDDEIYAALFANKLNGDIHQLLRVLAASAKCKINWRPKHTTHPFRPGILPRDPTPPASNPEAPPYRLRPGV